MQVCLTLSSAFGTLSSCWFVLYSLDIRVFDFIISCFIVFASCLMEVRSFVKRNRGGLDIRKR